MKVLKIIGIVLLALALIVAASLLIFSEKEPVGTQPREADEIAQAMLESVNNEAWENTRFVTWTFVNRNHYLWDKDNDLVQVVWGNNEVVFYTKDYQSGIAKVKGATVEGKKRQKLLDRAWGFFCNDSFWLNPVTKAFDEGTTRTLVTLKDGREGLKVKYESGGVTPGDAYVWILDENHHPIAWKMWVKIIPIGGLEVGWDKWEQLPTGADVCTYHKGLISLELTNVQGGTTLESVGVKGNPFLGFDVN